MKLDTNEHDVTYRDCTCISCNRDWRRRPFVVAYIAIEGKMWKNSPHISITDFNLV